MSVPLDLVAWLVQERYIISLFHAIRQNWLLTLHSRNVMFNFYGAETTKDTFSTTLPTLSWPVRKGFIPCFNLSPYHRVRGLTDKTQKPMTCRGFWHLGTRDDIVSISHFMHNMSKLTVYLI